MPIYMKLTPGKGSPIIGDAKDAAHRGWIELNSLQFSSTRARSDRDGPGDVVATKAYDRASNQLFRESIGGMAGRAVIEFVDANGFMYLRVTLEDALVSSYTVSGSPGGNPTEGFTLNYTKATNGYMRPSAPDVSTVLQSMLKNFLSR